MQATAFLLAIATLVPAADPKTERLFATRIYPLLARKCFACHGAKGKHEGKLDLTSRAKMLRGGETSKKVLVPGKPAASLLWAATSGTALCANIAETTSSSFITVEGEEEMDVKGNGKHWSCGA